MIVCLPTIEAVGRPIPYPTLTTNAKLTTSGRKNPDPIKDGEEPAASNDSTSYIDWWPQGTPSGGTPRVTSGWVEYEFPASGDGVGVAALLVRRYGPGRGPRAAEVAGPVAGRVGVEA